MCRFKDLIDENLSNEFSSSINESNIDLSFLEDTEIKQTSIDDLTPENRRKAMFACLSGHSILTYPDSKIITIPSHARSSIRAKTRWILEVLKNNDIYFEALSGDNLDAIAAMHAARQIDIIQEVNEGWSIVKLRSPSLIRKFYTFGIAA